MNYLPEATTLGFVQDPNRLDCDDTIRIDGKEYPKYLPEPLFIDGSQLVYKSSYSPEYNDFKHLFKAHSVESDFYICIPSQKVEPVVIPKNAAPVVVSSTKQNAFSATYQDEVNEFYSTLSAIKSKLSKMQQSILETDLSKLQSSIQFCLQNPSISNVNDLRELHASLLQKYASYVDTM